MLAREYREKLSEAVLELLWRQWGRLGVLGNLGGCSDFVLGPEALLVFTARFARYDQRLYDAVAAWLVRYSRLVNLPRLKAALRSARVMSTAALGYWAALVAGLGDKSWARLADACRKGAGKAVPMFHGAATGQPIRHARQDALALEYGLERNPLVLQEKKVAPQLPRNAATLLFTIRSHAGCSARAEMVLLLLLSPCCRLQELVDRSGYARAFVYEVMAELLLGRVAEKISPADRGGEYALSHAERWRTLLDMPARCSFPRWQFVYDALGLIWEAVSNPRLEALSQQTFHGEIRRVLQSSARRLFLHAGLPALQNMDTARALALPQILSQVQ